MDYQRFYELLQAHDTTVYKVAKETGIPPSTFSDWKSGRSVPKAEKLCRIANYFGVSLDVMLGSHAGKSIERDSFKKIRQSKMVAIIGEIRAGAPIVTNETLLGRELADVEDADDYFYLMIRGDSMKNIGMVNGSLVLFHRQQYADEGEVVACLVGGESATVKRFHRNAKNVYLLPENEDYSPIELTTDDFEMGEARILGVAKEIKIKL